MLSTICFQSADAQYSIKEVADLGRFQARTIRFYEDTKEWILSDGYKVSKINSDFKEIKLLFDTYPKYQFSLDRLPNKNFFSRHYDNLKTPPYGEGYEIRTEKLDSSAIYIMEDGLKSISALNPSIYLKIRQPGNDNKIIAWGINNCFIWGDNATAICNNGTIGIVRNINRKDSIYNIGLKNKITALYISVDGNFTAVGARDSAWYFIPNAHPEDFQKIIVPGIDEVSGFHFDEERKQLWIEEGSWIGLKSLTLYDYSSGIPQKIKQIPAEDLGLRSRANVNLAFDFKGQKLYVLSGLSKLIAYDLNKYTVLHDFWGETYPNGINNIYQIYFNTSDHHLYFSAEKSKNSNNSSNFLHRVDVDTVSYDIVSPRNSLDKNNLYSKGLQTAVNKVPESSYFNIEKLSLATNDLALMPFDKNEYLLYNIRSGNLIKSFQAKNIDNLSLYSRLREDNKVSLSPNGKYIFEWMIKAGIASGISDTLQMVMANVLTGRIQQSTIALSEKESKKVHGFTWDELGRPLFVQTEDGTYPSKVVSAYYLDSLLQSQQVANYPLTDAGVIYKAWNIPGTKKILIETGSLKTRNEYKYLLLIPGEKEPVLILTKDEFIDVNPNSSGFLLSQRKDNSTTLNWYDELGKLKHTSIISGAEYRIQHLAASTPQLYLTADKTKKACRLDLLTGNITPFESASDPDYNYRVSPDDKLLISVTKEVQAWQLEKQKLHKLYHLKSEKDFVDYAQIKGNYLVNDGRMWNLQNGFLVHSGLKNVEIANDSEYIQIAYDYDILENTGWDSDFKSQYELKSHKKLFSKTISEKTDLYKYKQQNNDQVFLLTKEVTSEKINNIYELPFTRDPLFDFFTYSTPQYALIVKKEISPFDVTLMKSTPDCLLFLDLNTGKYQQKLFGKISGLKQLEKNGDYLFYLLNQQSGFFQLYKTGKDGIIKIGTKIKLSADSISNINIVDEQTIVYSTYTGVEFLNVQTNEKEPVRFVYLSGRSLVQNKLFFDNKEKALYLVYDDGGIMKIVNKKVVECVKAMPSAERIIGMEGKYFVTMDKLGNSYFIDKETLETQLTLFTWKGNSFTDRKYMWLTNENYYMATPGVENNIHFVENSQVIPLKQGDLKYNRPDKVLEMLGASKKEIDFYNQLHQIRLNKYKVAEGSVNNQADIKLNVKVTPGERESLLQIDASASGKISKLQVVVNGCPMMVDKSKGNNTNQIHQSLSVPLNAGQNTIFTWVEDDKGNRSRFDERKIIGEFADSGKWHFVGIGVSKYLNSSYNLTYADKDIRDIAALLTQEYPGITIDTLLNEAVTAENIKDIATKLSKTNADDKIIVAFSGHGLLGESNMFWFGTYDIDFKKPEQNGFSMSAISAMLENVPARYRLITLDACHSGDVAQSTSINSSEPAKDTLSQEEQTDKKGFIVTSRKLGSQSSSQLLKSMQLVFTDQLSNTGINLIAASSGTEYALEGRGWNNGVFTYALLDGWRSDGGLHYRDLKAHIQQTVLAKTNGKQTPNTVMENGEINWWLIPQK